MPDALVTPQAVAEASGGQVPEGDPRLPTLIAGATDAIRLWCGWHVAPVIEETVTLDSEGSASLRLPTGRLITANGLKVDGVPVPDDAWDYSTAGMIRLRRGVFPDRFRAVEVTITHGWPQAPSLAAVITRSVLSACASPMGATREQAGSISATWARAGMTLSDTDRRELAPYRLQHWA